MSVVGELAEEPLSRISKLFLDRDHMPLVEALNSRAKQIVILNCGSDVARNAALQLALLTAARLLVRCFPGGVRVVAPIEVLAANVLGWNGKVRSLGKVLAESVVAANVLNEAPPDASGSLLLLGDCAGEREGLRITFDGWLARVGPSTQTPRLAERGQCGLAGVLAAALAVSEVFLEFAQVNVEACRRRVEVSLWRPDLDATHPEAFGPTAEYLPKDFWVFGLGHLGNALLWALGSLQYSNPGDATAYLCDFDSVEPENYETSVIFDSASSGLKTRRCAAWLEARGFTVRMMERRLGDNFRRETFEPGLAFCGFDSNPARRLLSKGGFATVIEAGLGDNADNFDTLSLHTLPNPRSATELWPDLDAHALAAQQESLQRVTRTNPAYVTLGKDDCGRVLLAGKAVAVPFVGMVAGCFQVAEALRIACAGPAYHQIKYRFGSAKAIVPKTLRTYTSRDLQGLSFCLARSS